MRYFVIQPILGRIYFSETSFWILVASTFFIGAAGYIINDYFDVKTDIINHPETVVIDKTIKRRVAMLLHLVFNGIGLVLGLWLAYRCAALRLLLFQIAAITFLWFYSTNFKKQLLTGNLVIAFLTAMIPLMPWCYELFAAHNSNALFFEQVPNRIKLLWIITLIYCGFAFMTSLIREIVKDMEDFKGDIQTGCKTMPISWGIISTKVFCFFLIIITIGILLFSILKLWHFHQETLGFYLIMTVFFPLSLLIIMLIRAKTPHHFKLASLLLKFIMLFGIAFTFLIKLVYEHH
jgi:4-hydroxybenzoate polyprenyltransferase